ncbi:lipase family protein [Corynebacterium sp.]|uniref:lipase family protein n=1 Tax=Corynebacterium sp. TaxID=1720 RepID=UPI0026DA8E9E|nr:lipase family protein [Corynebacterium sp.]MDO5032242.1 alpha/beta fold hydrolase [Corynebacterium sp.]
MKVLSRLHSLLAGACLSAAVVCSPALASAQAPAAEPAPAAQPGSVVGSWPTSHPGSSRGVTATKIHYASTLMDGRPTTVSGVVFEPSAPWSGPGERPTVVFAPGTRGAGDQCAPSNAGGQTSGFALGPAKQLTYNANYEYPFFQTAAERGIRVVVTDYIGLGTPGYHTYVNHIEEAHATLDAARAGLRFAGASPDAPVGFAGYSQGGGAAAAAAEFAASYAPDLNVKGTYAGAPPADLHQVMKAVDGSAIAHVLGYAVNGYSARSAEFYNEIVPEMNARGRQFLNSAAHACVSDSAATWGFTRTEQLTKSGESFSALLSRKPTASRMLAEQKLGQHPLNAPMMVANSPHDDLIPYEQARMMAGAYCAQGGTVLFEATNPVDILPKTGTNHAVPMFSSMPRGLDYLIERFHDVPAPSNCM